MESNCAVEAGQATVVDAQFVWIQVHTANEFVLQLMLSKHCPSIPQDLHCSPEQ